MDFNKVILVGRATANPELRTTPGGQPVTTVGIATNRTWTDKAGARQEATEFTNVVIWGKTAEVAAQFLVKGSTVLIEGRLQTRSWEDKQGQQHKTTEVLCERMQLGPRPMDASAKAAGTAGAGQSGKPSAVAAPKETDDDGLPILKFDEEEKGEIDASEIPF
jgi:single-strand DNA-binding protein